ncbi:MAG: hypothetical protein Q7Q71_04300 [Verrucomicrobiota bacterium JB023]|nr:hypothetical protein [Verrucomicrobiota bacterium JB023]
MSMNEQRQVVSPWAETTADVGSAVLGVAAGIVLGDLLQERARKPLALLIGLAGVAAVTPAIVDGVREVIAGPNTRRGVKRTLNSIRDAGAATRAELMSEEDEELFVG